MHERLSGMPGIECVEPVGGAFYCFPKVSSYYGKSLAGEVVKDSVSLPTPYWEKAHVAVVAGGGVLGQRDYVRMSYATSLEKIKEGLDRLEQALSEMK